MAGQDGHHSRKAGLGRALAQPGLRGEVGRALARRMGQGFRGAWHASPFYALSLRGKHSDLIETRPQDLWGGDVETANQLFTGHYHLGGEEIVCPSVAPWVFAANEGVGSAAWHRDLHGFGWLRHFAAADGLAESGPSTVPSAARVHARALIKNWLENCSHYNPLIWAPDVTARRLMAWSTYLPLIAELAEPVYRSAIFASIFRQARHLARTAGAAPAGGPRITALMGLVHISFVLEQGSKRGLKALSQLEKEIETEVQADGSLRGRGLTEQVLLLADLLSLKTLLQSAGHDVPDSVQHAIDQMVPFARMMKMGDGGLPSFHGAVADGMGVKGSVARSMADPFVTIDMVVKAANSKGRAARLAPYGGYARADRGRTVLLLDGAAPLQAPAGAGAYASLGAFEMSAGRHRLVVNCGAALGQNASWQRAARTSAAHSMAVLDDCSLMSFYDADGTVGRLVGSVPVAVPSAVDLTRDERDGATLIELVHNGWEAAFGLGYRRTLYLDESGGDLRGEDAFEGTGGEGAPVTVRFHLHPALAVSTTGGGGTVLINPPSGPGWSFRARGGDVSLEETATFADAGGQPRAAKQIVLRTRAGEDGAVLNWAFRRFDPPKPSKDQTEEA